MRCLLAMAVLFSALSIARPAFAQPDRVVSMNLCTDQLAMLIGPEQLISVSYLGQDADASAMAQQARTYPANRGLAEEVYLLRPDLVLAGTYTTPTSVAMLERLGIPVVRFEPANSLTDVTDRIKQMGKALGRPDRAARLIATFRDDLSAIHVTTGPRPVAATYHANGFSSGPGTLADAIIASAGMANLTATMGLSGGGRIPLESLVLAQPDLVISGRRFGASKAEAVLDHPALHRIRAKAKTAPVADRDWVCGTPHVLAAIRRLAEARTQILEQR